MAKNCNEAPPLTPMWVRVRMNVAHRLPTNVVQRSTSSHTGKNHGTETIQSGSTIHTLKQQYMDSGPHTANDRLLP